VASGVQVELRDEIGTLPVVTARAAYRVVQEGLTNAHKHAAGAGATVEVAGEPGRTVTVVVANGAPVDKGDVLPGAGVGLIGLSERVRLLGGHLEAGPDAFGGWRLEATIPWLDAAAEDRTPVAAGMGAGAPEGVTP
jgi:signal transduction histidine kinase